MKNKKYLVSLFVLVALLCLGIGYAAISKTLIIEGGVATGEATDLAGNFIVYFSKVEVNTTSAEGATVTASSKKTTAIECYGAIELNTDANVSASTADKETDILCYGAVVN